MSSKGTTASEYVSPIEITSEKTTDRRERLKRVIDFHVVTPLRLVLADWRGRFGVVTVLLFFFTGTIGPLLVEAPQVGGPTLAQPFQTMEYPLGTNSLGEGLLAMVVHSTPFMLKLVVSGALFSTAMATTVGLVAGYKDGLVDNVLSSAADVALTIPGLPLVIVLGMLFKPKDPFVIGLLLTINAWGGLARTIRSEVLAVRQEMYVEAAQVQGFSTGSILRKDILPNVISYVFVNFVKSARGVIFSSVGLYFLGVLPVSKNNWGLILQQGYNFGGLYLPTAHHWILVPMITIAIVSLGLIALAQATDRLFNTRIRAKHASTVGED